MISSMTGFGHAERVDGTKRIVVEIKSVNHRYLDLGVKTSRRISSLEPAIRDYLKRRIGRGKVDAYVHYEESADDTYTIRCNEKLARAYVENMARLAQEFSLDNDLTVTKLASYPDVLELVPEEKDGSELSDLILSVVGDACGQFLESRRTEGEKLRQDLMEKLSEMSGYVDTIEAKSPEIIRDYKARLVQKVEELMGDAQIDESRIATEVTIYADKLCVDEELVRLKSHVREMADTLSGADAVGRKLDFLAQEMNREANTILSKSTDAAVAETGISLKTLIEKIREQVQNLE